ncbi:MAG: hypothetical protein ACK5NN_02205 [Sphingomonadaceae bacterium]
MARRTNILSFMPLALLGVAGSAISSAPALAAEEAPDPHTPPAIHDFMDNLPPSNETGYHDKFEARWNRRGFVADYRMYNKHKVDGRKPKDIWLQIEAAFDAECTRKGGYIEPSDTQIARKTGIRFTDQFYGVGPRICMASPYRSLGALYTRSHDNPRRMYALILLSPDIVVTQDVFDAKAAAQDAERRDKEAYEASEAIKDAAWRKRLRVGSETNCGPVMQINADMILVYRPTIGRPKWFRRKDLQPEYGSRKNDWNSCPL